MSTPDYHTQPVDAGIRASNLRDAIKPHIASEEPAAPIEGGPAKDVFKADEQVLNAAQELPVSSRT